MLQALAIRDFAIVDRVEIALADGLTAFTGETGAGKSILVDALDAVTGARARADWVRPGAAGAEVDAVFEIAAGDPAARWLEDAGLRGEEGECMLRRSIGADGRSRGWVNARPVPVQALRELGALLVEIHGQHGQQALLSRGGQREILDAYGGHDDDLERLADLAARWRELERSAAAEPAALTEDERALLEHQLGEIDGLGLDADGIERLDVEQRRLAHAGEILAAAAAARDALAPESGDGAIPALERARRELERVARHDPEVAPQIELLESAAIEIGEVANMLSRRVDATEVDGAALADVERRLGIVHDLARKHRVAARELPEVAARLGERLVAADEAAARHARLDSDRAALLDEYRECRDRLHERRTRAAEAIGRDASAAMAKLGMRGGRLVVRVAAVADAEPRAIGGDEVEFEVAADPGHPPRPLARVASGGELSRISLAVQTLDRRRATVPTVVFDEVDAGIGGRVAAAVGEELRLIAGTRQVFCVTHLAQVASRAHHHFRVDKRTGDAGPRAGVERLAADERIEEIARMIGGERITERTRAHASEMLAAAAG